MAFFIEQLDLHRWFAPEHIIHDRGLYPGKPAPGIYLEAAEQLGLATSMMIRGLCAIIEAYLIYWAVVYLIARKFFKFSREWSAPLASGISICGVSASIATGGAISFADVPLIQKLQTDAAGMYRGRVISTSVCICKIALPMALVLAGILVEIIPVLWMLFGIGILSMFYALSM